jgi:hypothetical protein
MSHQRGTKTKTKENKTAQSKKKKNPTKCPKFKCNTVSVNFLACKCSSFIVLSKGERKKKIESGDSSVNGICSCVSPACCCHPAVARGFIYADLRSELNTH